MDGNKVGCLYSGSSVRYLWTSGFVSLGRDSISISLLRNYHSRVYMTIDFDLTVLH